MGLLRGLTYQSLRTRLDPGDVLVLYSDGVTEAQNQAGEEYGEERLAAALSEMRAAAAPTILEGLLAGLQKFMNGTPAADDVTLVIGRRTA